MSPEIQRLIFAENCDIFTLLLYLTLRYDGAEVEEEVKVKFKVNVCPRVLE